MSKRFARLPKTAFAATYARGKLLRHPLLHVRVLSRDDRCETLGVAFAVGKKLGKATVRNHLRRRMRAAFFEEVRHASTSEYSHDEKALLVELSGANLVFVASPAALEADFLALRGAIAELMKRAARR